MKKSWLSAAALGCLAVSCGSVHEVRDHSEHANHHGARVGDDDEDGDEGEESIALNQVPEAVKKAALAAVPGMVLESAEKETEDGSLIYCLEGRDGDERVEVEVRASDAKVTEVERGDDEDED